MRRLQCALLATAAVIGFASIASAADMPTKEPVYKAAPVPMYNWTGWYVGANAGYAWGRANTTTAVPGGVFSGTDSGFYSGVASPAFNSRGFTGGLQLGYNQQVNNWAWGIETDFNAFALRGSTNTAGQPASGGSPLFSNTEVNSDWLFTLRPRVGILATPQWLLYATGGLAIANIKYSQNNLFSACAGPGGTCIEAVSVNKTKVGWAVGGGVEAALMGNWTAKAEYLYVDLGSVSTTGADNAVFSTFTHNAKLNASIARLGLNYRFGM